MKSPDRNQQLRLLMQQSYQGQEHSKQVSKQIDDILGFRSEAIEDELFDIHKNTLFNTQKQAWYGLELQSLQTPYREIVDMIQLIGPASGDVWIDLGAGYGRIGIALGLLCSQVHFIGYELDQLRVDEGNRVFAGCRFDFAKLKQADMSDADFVLRPANVYFIYDFGSKEDIYKVLNKLQEIAKYTPISLIARGKGIRGWIMMDFPWLYDSIPPVHQDNWSLFATNEFSFGPL